jgi:hypothetical protein
MIPLQPADWKILEYRNIKPNKVTFSEGQMNVKVESSNNPIVHAFDRPKKINGFEVEAEVLGEPLPVIKKGDWDDDALLRVGFVAQGDRKMNKALLFISPRWVKELFKLAPQGHGIDKIYFYLLGREPQSIGQQRIFPGSKDLISEEVIALAKSGTSQYNLTHKFKKPMDVAGIWLSMDGDFTRTQFMVKLKKISVSLEK